MYKIKEFVADKVEIYFITRINKHTETLGRN